MKKFLILMLALVMMLCLVSCGGDECTEHIDENNDEICDNCGKEYVYTVMTYEEYCAAEIDDKVCVETYIQAKQGWWEDKGVGVATFYTQSEDGAYLLYNMPCTKADYDTKLTVGTKLHVIGYKAEWAGEVEIVDATYRSIEGSYEAGALDVTDLLGTDALINHQNKKVSFTGLTVEAANEAGDAFMYGWDGSGSEGGDIYFKASVGGKTYTFVIESYLTGADTDVYKAAQALTVGDVIYMNGFLYWYEGVQPHITSINTLMTYDEYNAAAIDDFVFVETYIQAKQGWWEDKGVGVATFYTQSEDGAYLLYNMPCTKADYDNKLVAGAKIYVIGYKAEWAGEVEIIDAVYKVAEGTYNAPAFDATELLGSDTLINHQNKKVSFTGLTIEAANEAGDAFMYGWDGSGSEGGDIYFKASIGGETYTFVIESYLTGADTDVYKAVQALSVGDTVDMEGFLYWYEGAQPHIVSVTVTGGNG